MQTVNNLMKIKYNTSQLIYFTYTEIPVVPEKFLAGSKNLS